MPQMVLMDHNDSHVTDDYICSYIKGQDYVYGQLELWSTIYKQNIGDVKSR